jgi:glycosyltransferase involved in cell wall biosynthesis
MNGDVKISVLMSAYNAERFIGEAVQSVLDQTFREFEFIIINDGSTDGTEKVIRSFNDPRIVLLNQENKGLAAALNLGLQKARSPFIARFDADDVCYPHRLEKQYRFMTSHPQYAVAGSAADYVDHHGEFVFTSRMPAQTGREIKEVVTHSCPFIHSSVMYRKEAILQCGGYNPHAHSFEDHLLWTEVLEHGKGFNMKEPLIKVRLNPQSVTIDEQWRTRRFHQIKQKALQSKTISREEGDELMGIIQQQDRRPIKEGAYYSLLSKKYLWNNYQPAKARKNLKKVMMLNRLHWKSYAFYLLSYMPRNVVHTTYKLLKG